MEATTQSWSLAVLFQGWSQCRASRLSLGTKPTELTFDGFRTSHAPVQSDSVAFKESVAGQRKGRQTQPTDWTHFALWHRSRGQKGRGQAGPRPGPRIGGPQGRGRGVVWGLQKRPGTLPPQASVFPLQLLEVAGVEPWSRQVPKDLGVLSLPQHQRAHARCDAVQVGRGRLSVLLI